MDFTIIIIIIQFDNILNFELQLFLKFYKVGRKALPFAGKKLYTSKPSIQGNNMLVYFKNLKIIIN